MKRRAFVIITAALALALGPAGNASAAGGINVFAAASLKEAFEAAAPAFTKSTGIAVTFNFGGSDALATQIEQGAPADVFASANEAQMKRVVDGNLTSGSPQTFARNRLVLIVPKANKAGVTGLSDLTKDGLKVVLAAATVPVGNYARAAFAKMAGHDGYPPDYPAAVLKNVVSNELDVKAVATKIALGEGDAGVVYATDVTPALALQVTAFAFPATAAPDATYPIVALKNAGNVAGARAFVEFALSAPGQAYLRARGFIAP
jgi:molybdate transport system substrate-binding protein